MEQMTLEQYDGIAEAFDKAEESVVPFPIVDGDDLIVVGDANKTEIIRHDFDIRFVVPTESEDGGISYKAVTKHYPNVQIRLRDKPFLAQHITTLMQFFYKVGEDGSVTKLDERESVDLIKTASRVMVDAMYELVAVALRIDPALVDYMDSDSVVVATREILLSYTDLVNAANSFFDKSSGKRL